MVEVNVVVYIHCLVLKFIVDDFTMSSAKTASTVKLVFREKVGYFTGLQATHSRL